MEKVRVGQAKLVLWDDIKENPPPQLKVSLIMVQAHKSKVFRSILDLSFGLHLRLGGILTSVNDSTVKFAPQGALDQLGHALSRIIHAFAKAEEGDKIFMAKWDIKDGFWCMDCAEGEELRICPPPGGGETGHPSCTHILANGLGGITTIFLHRN